MSDLIPSNLHISGINTVAADRSGKAIVINADGLVRDVRTEVEIAITTDLAPAMALALLSTTAKARAERDGFDPALEVLAIGVVRAAARQRMRMQLLFEKGLVLPLEMSWDAGRALSDGLLAELGTLRA
jgi:hypothetical protein